MSKDPAFLFYSKDFYEGTRMMLPEERACYIDLLIYQHQNGTIPNDIKRLLLYCGGIDEATLIATLEAKFEKTAKGWENNVLKNAISERENFKNKQSENGKLGQFWKKSKLILSEKDFKTLQKLNNNKPLILGFIQNNEITKDTLKALLKQCLNIYANANGIVNANEDVNKNENKGGMGENIIFPFDSENFKLQWNLWKDYKSKEHKFSYKTIQSEQAALKQLSELSGSNEQKAIEIIHQSLANGWKGFFELKQQSNGTKQQTFTEQFTDAYNSDAAKRYASMFPSDKK